MYTDYKNFIQKNPTPGIKEKNPKFQLGDGSNEAIEYQAWLDLGNTPTLYFSQTKLINDRIDILKKEIANAIFKYVPDWKQRNLLMRAQELQFLPSLSTTEQTELNEIQLVFQWIKDVRTEGNNFEQLLLNTTTEEELSQYEYFESAVIFPTVTTF